MRASALLMCVAMLLSACGGTAASGDPAPASPAVAGDARQDTAPAATAPAHRLIENGVDYACRTDQDCAIKDIGNCCGYYPACVNAESPTFPDQVKAQCASEGTMAVCGYPEIAGCTCVEGRCTNVSGVASVAPVQ
jgi:hypothetical protein